MFRGIEIFFTLAAVVGGPLLAVMIVPALAKRFLKAAGASNEAPPSHEQETRSEELDGLRERVAELEERADFAERLLAQQRDAALAKGKV